MAPTRNPRIPLNRLPLAAGPRLVCFHHAGGAASAFRPWLEDPALAGLVVCPVELPGRGSRFSEPLALDAGRLAEDLWSSLDLVLGRENPVLLFGHSLGALIAYEIARRMEHSGRPPRALIVSARRSPTRPTPDPWRHRLNDAALVAELRRLGGTADDVFAHRELLELVLPVVRADFTLTETYRPPANPGLSCPIVAVRGADDIEVSSEDIAAWEDVAKAGFDLRSLGGGHFYLNDPAARHRLLSWIAAITDKKPTA